MQTTLSVSLCVLFLASVGACSSEPTGSKGGAGSGGILPGGGGTGSSAAGTASQSGGSIGTPLGGASTGTSGSSSTSGAGGTSSAAQQCLDTPISCVDSETITGCNPDTLMNETVNCNDLIESRGPGLIAQGCTMVDGRSVCGYDFQDAACRDGAPAFAVCYTAATGDDSVEALDWYFECFADTMFDVADEGQPEMLVGAHTLIPCFTKHIMDNTVDCDAAVAECFPASPSDGAGGAAP